MSEEIKLEFNKPITIVVGDQKFKLWNSGNELLVKPEKEGDGLYFTGFRPSDTKIDSDLMTYMRTKIVSDKKIEQKIIDFEESYNGKSDYKLPEDLIDEI